MAGSLAYNKDYAFNAICPYFTMFPLEYPLKLLKKHKSSDPIVLDPFCGRGTTMYAARRLGLSSYGFDTSPIATAIARAKLASASSEDVLALAEKYIARKPKHVPNTAFFKRAFSKNTREQLCSLREGLLSETRASNTSSILRAATLGCLHGPLNLNEDSPSYFSNQMPRTFASKPAYSLKYWRERDLYAPEANVIDVLRKKLARISDLDSETPSSHWQVKCRDSRLGGSFDLEKKASVIITSPPYYGMQTYEQDQWLRLWFLGGPEHIDYDNDRQLRHSGHEDFVADLAKVWTNCRKHSAKDAHLYIRFGALPSAKSDAKKLLTSSLEKSEKWKLVSVRTAKTSRAGKRQADYMGGKSKPDEEFDFHAVAI